MMIKKILITQLLEFLGKDLIKIEGDITNAFFDNIPDAAHVTETSLDWVNTRKTNKQEIAENSSAKLVVVDPSVDYTPTMADKGKILLVVEKPRNVVASIANHFFIEQKLPGIHPSAVVDKEAIIDQTAYIGPGCVVGKAKIGANTVLMANVTIYDDVIIGERCLIQAGVVIGTDGLGCSRDEYGVLTKFPHLGGVLIGNDIEIGANSQIAKGSFGDTIIEDGCKMNGLCFIAHNCHLEENVWITGDTMLCGSVYVGKNTTIFSNVVIRDQKIIGKEVTIGMGAVVTKNIPDGEVWFGSPAHKKDKE